MINKQRSHGFTLIELMLAMAFVTFVLVFIVTVIVQTMRIYNKGLAIRQINQVGRQVTEDMTRTIRYSDSAALSTEGDRSNQNRLCANGVSYVWNIENAGGDALDDGGVNDQANYYEGGTEPVRLARVIDRGGQLCAGDAKTEISKANAVELISPQLAVQRLDFAFLEAGKIVDINLLVSTKGENRPEGPGQATPSGFACAPGGAGAFCAFGDFNTTVYVRN